MKWWPFAKTKVPPATAVQPAEPSTMVRLLTRNCSRDEFILLFVKLLQEAMPQAQLQMTGDDALRIVQPSGKEATTFLANAWIAYERSPDDREALLQRHLAAATSLHAEEEPVQPERVIATIKDAQFMQVFSKTDQPAAEHLCGDLWVLYAEDFPEKTQSLKWSRLAAAGIERSSLRALAVENLRRLLPAVELHGEGPWFMLSAGGDYTASVLLLDHIWQALEETVDGYLVAVAPARDLLLFTGSDSPAGLSEIRRLAAEALSTGNYLISDTLLVRRENEWKVFNSN